MTGAPTFIAMSITLQIFWAWRSESEPPKTVKSWAKTKTRRPLIVPDPVTTPSPGTFCSAMPKSTQLCSTYMSYSSRLPGSSSTVSRSRAVSRPLACCASILFSPPPSRACARRFSSSSMVVAMERFLCASWREGKSSPERGGGPAARLVEGVSCQMPDPLRQPFGLPPPRPGEDSISRRSGAGVSAGRPSPPA